MDKILNFCVAHSSVAFWIGVFLLLVLTRTLSFVYGVIKAICDRNRPIVQCDCACHLELDDEDEWEEDDDEF